MHARHYFYAVASLLLGSTAVQAAPDAHGRVSLEKQDWDVADAIAYRSGDLYLVVLSDKPYDRAAFAKDGKLDDFDFIHHHMEKDASTLRLKFGTDFKLETIEFTIAGGGGARSGDLAKAFTPTAKHGASELAGKFDYTSGADKVSIAFDLPVETDKPARPGKPLANDGGEPGRAFLKHIAAIHSGNLDQLIAVSPPERRELIQQAKASGEAKDMMPMMQSMTPTQPKVLGGVQDGEAAQVDFEGMLGGKTQKGTAELMHIGGVWYVAGLDLEP